MNLVVWCLVTIGLTVIFYWKLQTYDAIGAAFDRLREERAYKKGYANGVKA